MTVSPGGRQLTVIEDICWDKPTYFIDFRVLEHPTHKGNVTNKLDVRVNEEGKEEVWVTFKMDWTFQGQGPDPIAHYNIKVAVDKTI